MGGERGDRIAAFQREHRQLPFGECLHDTMDDVARIGRTSVTYECAAYRVEDDVLMVTANQTVVLVDLDERKPCPIPDWYREKIREFEGAALEL